MSFAVSGAAAAGGGLSILKDLAIDKPAAAKQLALQAKTAEFSPWTGLKPQAVAQPNLGAAALTGIASGAQMGQSSVNAAQQTALQNALIKSLGQGPYANVQMAGDPGAQTAALNGMVG